eukprot:TRINITY_DN9635_c0_g1_i1.p2 TRINITY_DN9635_c0_g1~~TRINITY_DN9635_c0_g1_i1.p2  ORF type:complete len:128 (+),score=3.60 TRINITY_DN9635_c0_g1_i1:350-733(+)
MPAAAIAPVHTLMCTAKHQNKLNQFFLSVGKPLQVQLKYRQIEWCMSLYLRGCHRPYCLKIKIGNQDGPEVVVPSSTLTKSFPSDLCVGNEVREGVFHSILLLFKPGSVLLAGFFCGVFVVVHDCST